MPGLTSAICRTIQSTAEDITLTKEFLQHRCFSSIYHATKYQILMSQLWCGLALSSNSKALFTSNQKLHCLLQYVTGEETRVIQGFTNDRTGFLLSLKRLLKYLFGQKLRKAQAHVSRITKQRQITSGYVQGWMEYCYTISDYLITLKQLGNEWDLYSTDVPRKAIRRLPSKFYNRWG